MRLRVSWALFLAVALASVIANLWAYGELPDRAATHFGGSGEADGWSSREANLGASLAVTAVLLLIPLITWAITRGSLRFVNFATKRQRDYWTAPEHRAEFRRRFLAAMLVFSAMTNALLLVGTLSTVAANRSDPPVLGNSMWVALGVYLIGTVLWLIDLFRLLRPPADPPTAT